MMMVVVMADVMVVMTHDNPRAMMVVVMMADADRNLGQLHAVT